MTKIELECDRCGKGILGYNLGGLTVGYYATTLGSYWAVCANTASNEERICEECMWASPGYKETYGEIKAIKGETVQTQPSLSGVSRTEGEVVE